ncbi:MAG: methyltransferase [Eubacteriaceae bacterium]|nr:methyltransferase [Eubacteriaceae bacterium]
MFVRIPYSDKELFITETIVGPTGAKTEVRNFPVSRRENIMSLYREKKPFWIPAGGESGSMSGPWEKHLARGSRSDFLDDFGIQWTYEPIAGGSIVRGDAKQLLDNVNEWKEKVIIPDIDSWEWEEYLEKTKVDMSKPLQVSFSNGFWFERLISFMGFMPAAMALIDDDQIDALKEMFGVLTDLGCRVVDKYCEYFPALDIINIHDDWGSQKAPFFSEDVARDIFLPFMKQYTDHVHSLGRIVTLHSCGHNFDRAGLFVEAGFDGWTPQPMNDVATLYKLYGDRMVFGVVVNDPALPKLDEAGQRAAAREFVDRYSEPGKPITLGGGSASTATPAFTEEVYIYSRKVYAERG